LEKELSRKEKRLISQADDFRIIISITTLTMKNEAIWEKVFHGGPQDANEYCYYATVTIRGVETELSCYDWVRQLSVSCGKETKNVHPTRKDKPAFDYLFSLIKKQVLEREKLETQKRLEEDTTVLFPNLSEQKAAEPTDRENLQEVVDFLTEI
jgi:hypothetical protein